MSDSSRFNAALSRMAEASKILAEKRARAREEAIGTIRLIERNVIAALGEDGFRGMSVIANRYTSAPLYAARVHARGEGGIDTPLSMRERSVLVVMRDGRLARVQFEACDSWSHEEARDEGLKAEDLPHVARSFFEVIRRHTTFCDRRSAEYERMTREAERLRNALLK